MMNEEYNWLRPDEAQLLRDRISAALGVCDREDGTEHYIAVGELEVDVMICYKDDDRP